MQTGQMVHIDDLFPLSSMMENEEPRHKRPA
jgi:hypothetical protein